MTYKIIGDSCMDLTEELKRDPHFHTVPLTLQVDSHQIRDDETFDQKNFLELVRQAKECPKTACPSPEDFREQFEGEAEWIFVVTLSHHLSGSYNSACLAKQLYEEEHGADGESGGKRIAVIDSLSASAGELSIALQIRKLCESGLDFDSVVEQTVGYRDRMGTYFVLESLDILRKNGRLSGLQAFFATALNIKPIMAGDRGVIVKLEQARGINRALGRMADLALKQAGRTEDRRLVIAHCNNRERAEYVRDLLCGRAQFKEVVITDTAGVSTVYAGDGGIVLTL